jgi:hypothetical protein
MQQHSELIMSDQDRDSEQHDAAVLPNREKDNHIRIDLGKRFCLFGVVLAALLAGVSVAARFVPRNTPVGVYRAQPYACMHEGAKAVFVVTPDFHCFMIYYDEEDGRGGHSNVFRGKWKQEEDGSFTFFDFVVSDLPEEHISRMEPVLNGRSYWGGMKTTAPGEPEFFLPRILSGFL